MVPGHASSGLSSPNPLEGLGYGSPRALYSEVDSVLAACFRGPVGSRGSMVHLLKAITLGSESPTGFVAAVPDCFRSSDLLSQYPSASAHPAVCHRWPGSVLQSCRHCQH